MKTQNSAAWLIFYIFLPLSKYSTEGLVLPSSFSSFVAEVGGKGRQRESLKAELLDLIKSSPPGVGRFEDEVKALRFEEIFTSELPALNPTPDPARSSLFSGEWECIWTNENELNFAVRSGLFGLPWRRTYQNIDIEGCRLDNFIEFEEGGLLTVGSTISPDESDGKRFNFRFSEASLKWRSLQVPLPPVGQGWGDLLYLDDDMRLQRDIRGDLLIGMKFK